MKLDLTGEQGLYRRNSNVFKKWYNLDFLGQIKKISFEYIYIYFALSVREENHIYWGSKYTVNFGKLYKFNTL